MTNVQKDMLIKELLLHNYQTLDAVGNKLFDEYLEDEYIVIKGGYYENEKYKFK